MKKRIEIVADHRVPVILGHHRQPAVTDDTGIVDEHVYMPCRLRSLVDQQLSPFGTADVGPDRCNTARQALGQRQGCISGSLIGKIGGINLRSGSGKGQCDGPADSARAASDHNDIICKIHDESVEKSLLDNSGNMDECPDKG